MDGGLDNSTLLLPHDYPRISQGNIDPVRALHQVEMQDTIGLPAIDELHDNRIEVSPVLNAFKIKDGLYPGIDILNAISKKYRFAVIGAGLQFEHDIFYHVATHQHF